MLLSPLPHSRTATASASIGCSTTDPGHGSRGAPFGRVRPAILAVASYRMAAVVVVAVVAGPSGAVMFASKAY